jgi:hypothetical protein
MATIEKRTYANGETTYRAKIRTKGRPTQTANFKRKTDAKKWAQTTKPELWPKVVYGGLIIQRTFEISVSHFAGYRLQNSLPG